VSRRTSRDGTGASSTRTSDEEATPPFAPGPEPEDLGPEAPHAESEPPAAGREAAPEPADDDEAETTAEYRPVHVKKAPPLPGQPDHPEPADLVELGDLPMSALVSRLLRYGVKAHEGMDRARLLVAFMRFAHKHGLRVVGAGQLEVLPDGYGFLRSMRNAFFPSPDDLYVSPDHVREYSLRIGATVRGTIRHGRRNDKYFAVDELLSVNDRPPEEARTWQPFDTLTPIFPDRRILLETPERSNLSTRVLDLVTPIGFGQRALIVSPPRAGKTVLLKNIANAISMNFPETKLLIFLVDERPEEVTDMRRSTDGEVIASTFDEQPKRHIQVADRVYERMRSLVESGYDVVVMLDSLTRLGRAYNAAARTSGRILSGGIEATALQKPRRFFSAARNIEGGGSLTIIATALVETNSRMDEVIFEEFKGTGNMEIVLSRHIAEQRYFPAIDLNRSGTRMEDLLYDPDEARCVAMLRETLAPMQPVEAIEKVLEKLRKTQTNAEFLLSIVKSAARL